jgi:hypothetical protein
MKGKLLAGCLGLCCLAAVFYLVPAHGAFAAPTMSIALTAPTYVADGGAPAPPFPNNSSMMLADGGAPAPPFPNNSAVILADGGAPAPPFPNTSSVMVADGGAPAPPFPNNSVLEVRVAA